MRKVNLILSVILLACLAGCSQADIERGKEMTEVITPRTISAETALADLNWQLAHMSNNATRSITYSPEEMLTIRRSDFLSTRSTPDAADTPLAYIINFQQDGYAILGADPRQSSVIALVETGRMTPSELITAKQAADNKEETDTPTCINALVANYILNAPLDPQNQSRIVGPPSGDWVIAEHQEPLMTTKWGQNGIYKKYCYNDAGELCAAGCTAIALSQIMVYNHKTFGKGPNYIIGLNTDWSKIDIAAAYADLKEAPADIQDAAAKFIHEVGVAIDTEYHPGVSYSNTDNVISFMNTRQMNRIYTNPEKVRIPSPSSMDLHTFTQQYVRPMIYTLKRPLLIDGYDNYTDIDGQIMNGHSWVVDGWMKKTKPASSGAYYFEEYIYCNYGWYGGQDGLYAFGVFANNYNYFNYILNYRLM